MAADYYQVLGVSRDASAEELQRAYRKLARRNHPDVNKDPAAEDRFKEINEAYHVLADPKLRERYDRYGPQFRSVPEGMDDQFAGAGAGAGRRGAGQRRGQAGRGAGWPGQAGPSEYGPGGAVDLEELFGDLFGGRGGSGAWNAGADQEAELELSVEEAYRGGRRRISLGPRSYEVTIPAGVVDGQRIRLSGEGGQGRGGPAGDLYLVVRIAPHPKFRLSGRDITVDLPLAPWEAALGAAVPVETPSGEATVSVPAGSSSGRKLRLRGQGMPHSRGKPGDLYAEVKIMVPDRLSERERGLFDASGCPPSTRGGADERADPLPPARVSRYQLDAFAARAGLHPDLLHRFVALGLVNTYPDSAGRLWFDAADLLTVARIRRLHNDLSLNYAAVGLVLDLLDEIERLQALARLSRS